VNLTGLFRIGLRALAINKLRSALTMLGIVIGVGAVIVMIAVGAGAQKRVEEQIRALGSNLLLVMSGARTQGGVRLALGSGQTLSEDDAIAINREIPEALAAPALRGGAQVVWGNTNWSTQIYGTTPEYLLVREWALAAGRSFEPPETSGAGKVCLIGSTVARELFDATDPVGQVVRIKRVPFTVIGVLETKGQSLMGTDQDDLVIMPISTARGRVLGSATQAKQRAVGTIWVKAAEGYDTKLVEEQVRALLRQRHRLQPGSDDDFSLRNLQEVMSAQEASSRVLALLLAAVASVSLLVGGIGIMNIMLVSVTERTREIGIRKAIGAKRRDILKQFLIESMTISLMGGILGILIGVAGAQIIPKLPIWKAMSSGGEWESVISYESIVVSFVFSCGVGVFFGLYPALKASRLNPVEALRYE